MFPASAPTGSSASLSTACPWRAAACVGHLLPGVLQQRALQGCTRPCRHLLQGPSLTSLTRMSPKHHVGHCSAWDACNCSGCWCLLRAIRQVSGIFWQYGGLKHDVGQHTLRDDNKYMFDVAESCCPCCNAMAAVQPVLSVCAHLQIVTDAGIACRHW